VGNFCGKNGDLCDKIEAYVGVFASDLRYYRPALNDKRLDGFRALVLVYTDPRRLSSNEGIDPSGSETGKQ
jgi:hypothetical protein